MTNTSPFKIGDLVVFTEQARRFHGDPRSDRASYADKKVHTITGYGAVGADVIIETGDMWASLFLDPKPVIVGDTVLIRSSRSKFNSQHGILADVSGIRYAVDVTTGTSAGERMYTTAENLIAIAPEPKVEETYTFTAAELKALQAVTGDGTFAEVQAARKLLNQKLNPTHTQVLTVTVEMQKGFVLSPGLVERAIRDATSTVDSVKVVDTTPKGVVS